MTDMEKYRANIFKNIDRMIGHEEKLIFLNQKFLRALTREKEDEILRMIAALTKWGK